MKTMKLLPLKIAVTSAMIVGLGAASTTNAQAQDKSPIEQIQDDAQNRIQKLKLIENEDDADKLKQGELDQKKFQQYMVINQYANVSTMMELNRNTGVNTQKIENLRTLFETRGRTVKNNEQSIKENKDAIAKNKANIQDLAKTQLAGVEVMTELNKNVEANNASIEDLYEYGQEVANSIGEIHDHNRQQNETLENLITNSTNNTDNIAKNKDNIKTLAEAQLESATFLGGQIQENKDDIAKNKSTLAEHTKKIDDNRQAIEAKLGGKADLQKLSELKTSVDKNQADIDNNINNIYELAQQQDQHSSDIKTLAKASAANTDNIVKNKADADASFKTLTENQNTLIEKDKAQDALIAKNKADADAKLQGVQLDIANNKTTLAQHTKKIDDNQKDIEAKLGSKADAQALNSLNDKVNGFDGRVTALDTKVNTFDGRISALDTKVNAFDGRITALDSKVENGMAAQAALSGLFQPYSVGKFNATAALGGYGSKSAVAIGAGYRVNPNLAFKAGAAINTSGDKKGSYNIGVNYEF